MPDKEELKSITFKIEKYFQSETELIKVLKHCDQFFVTIDETQKKFRIRKDLSVSEIKNDILKILGCYGVLNPILSIAEAEEGNRRVRQYATLLNNHDASEGKFVDGKTEKLSLDYVSTYRKVRKIIKGYVEVAKTTLSVGQSILKSAIENRDVT